MDEIYIVAVDSNPLRWAVQCDICDDLVTDYLPDGDEIDMLEQDHIDFHTDFDTLPLGNKSDQ